MYVLRTRSGVISMNNFNDYDVEKHVDNMTGIFFGALAIIGGIYFGLKRYENVKMDWEAHNRPVIGTVVEDPKQTLKLRTDEGRTIEQKRGLVKDITEAVCKNFDVKAEAVTVHIKEGKKENRGKGGKRAMD